LLKSSSKHAAAAADVFKEDLEHVPENGWSLKGLMDSLRVQGKPYFDVEARFRQAWKEADTRLTSACF